MFSFNGGGSDQAGSLASLSSCAAWIWHLIEELLPVDSKEPLAFLDIIDSVFQIAESLPQIGRKELFDENLFPNIFFNRISQLYRKQLCIVSKMAFSSPC